MQEIPIPIAEVIEFFLLGVSEIIVKNVFFEHWAQYMLLFTNEIFKLSIQIII